MCVVSKYRITSMIFNSFQNPLVGRWVELFSYCCIYRAAIGEQGALFGQVCGVPDLERSGGILAGKLRITLVYNEADGQLVIAIRPAGPGQDGAVLCGRIRPRDIDIGNSLKHSPILEVVPECVLEAVVPECVAVTTVPERIVLEVVPERIAAATVPECVAVTTVPERIAVATVPERIVLEVVPECVLEAVVPERIVLEVVPECVPEAVVPERAVVAILAETVAIATRDLI
ncbi:MAG: hypothetical protein II809_01820, partial [Bacteroidales bacterium]|nr:hypothetical protein [Bacteroidales bacterium]